VTETRAPLSPDLASKLAGFARACKAAARAVSLYPAAHPAIGTTLGRLVDAHERATVDGSFPVQVKADGMLVNGAAPGRPDPMVAELADLLHRQLIGTLVLHGGADAQTWRSLLLLLTRTPEENRGDGGIAHLWSRSGGSSIEIHEIDYAEVLRERAGDAAVIDDVIAACLKGTPRLELDDQTLRALLEIVNDPARLQELVTRLEASTAAEGRPAHAAAFLKLLKGIAEFVARTRPEQLEGVLKTMADAAGRLSADAMVSLLAQRMTGEAKVGALDVVGAVVDRISDPAIAGFVADSVIEERGGTDRLAQAFEALVPEVDRKRQLLALAEEQVAQSPLGREETFEELWSRVEKMLTSYSDQPFVSEEYGRELSGSRAHALDVEKTGDDPPERISAWLSTVGDAALRELDFQLLVDLLAVETEPARWHDVADTIVDHLDDLARVGQLEPAWALAERIVEDSTWDGSPRRPVAGPVLDRLGRSAFLQQASRGLRTATDEEYARFKRLLLAVGPSVIAPLAETLATEQDPRARRRIREVLVGFGPRGRDAVQELLVATSWEVRRTAAYLLSEFGDTDNLDALEPLLTDREPRVLREALRAVLLSGNQHAFDLVLRVLARDRQTRAMLAAELAVQTDERAAPLFSYLLPRIDRQTLRPIFLTAIELLGTSGGNEAVEALKHALLQGDFWSPLRTRQHRRAAADALRRVGTAEAVEALHEISAGGPRGARAAARAALKGVRT
jgi:HEAT repeat protein